MQRGVEQVGAALHALHQRRHEPGLAAQEAAHVVAEAVVPLQPAPPRPGRAELVGADASHGSATIRTPRRAAHASSSADERPVAASDGRQVEAEPVDRRGRRSGRATRSRGRVPAADDGVDVVAAAARLDVRAVVVEAVVVAVVEAAQVVASGPVASTSVVWLNTTSSHTSMSRSWAAATRSAELAGGVVAGGVRRCTAPKASGM